VARDGSLGRVPGNAEHDAEELLAAVWEGRPLPVDPIKIAQQLGVKVYKATLDEGVSGMLIKEPAKDPEIYVNSADSINRQRFTCAHELGHYIKRVAAGADEWANVDYRNPLSSEGNDPDEVYANRFAASLLMPRREVERLHKEYRLGALAYEFGVSEEAMNYRLDNLKLKQTSHANAP
jgi:Zn-dependent peptidase ImmA (M78 family)